MYAQIFLGVAMFFIGMCNLLGVRGMVNYKVKQTLTSKEKLDSFQRNQSLPYFLMGILFISMGIVESKEIFQTATFTGLYILLAAVPLTIALTINKKFSGHWWIR